MEVYTTGQKLKYNKGKKNVRMAVGKNTCTEGKQMKISHSKT